MMENLVHPIQTTFSVHLIAIAGSQRRPRVRLLFVATEGADAVYEAQGSLARCIRLLLQLPSTEVVKQQLAEIRRDFGRNRYATLPPVRASVSDLESLGLQRVDK